MVAIPNESKLPVGTILVGKYRVTREIGRGGMAAVYEAEQISLGKRIAVKVLASELSASTVVIERFFREARAAASVKSPHIVDVYDSGRLDDGRPFIAMELLEGESLYDRMARIRLIDPKTTVRVISHCAKGLMKAHAIGIVHRDLKPENIFIMMGEDGEEVCKVLDFGLAKFYAPMHPDEKAARLTREGAVFGTPAYMSPEQVKGQGSVDHRADLWALGCMAFECLIGRPVWNTDQGVAMTFAAIATAPIPVPSKIRADLPVEFDHWFAKALSRDPNDRFQSARELADALGHSLGSVSGISISGDFLDGSGRPSSQVSSEKFVDSSRQRDADSRRLQLLGPSAADLPPTAAAAPSPRTGPLRYALTAIALVGATIAAVLVWMRVLHPQISTPTVVSTVSSSPTGPVSAQGSSSVDPPGIRPLDAWTVALFEGQKLFSAGDSAGAQRKFKDALDQGGGATARVVAEQTKIAAAGTGPCKMTAFSHPRMGIGGNIGRPSIAVGPKGAIVTWTDDHEQPQKDHAYSVVIDATGRPVSAPRDLTPEAGFVLRPSLLSAGDRTALLYWDRVGRDAGIRVRWIDADGRIAGRSVLVGAARAGGNFWPSLANAPVGFVVAWQDDRDKEGDDLYLRQLSPNLDPSGPELRATDYAPMKPRGVVSVKLPGVAVAANTVFAVYRLEREPQHLVMRMRVPLGSLTKGLDERMSGPKKDRELGDVKLVNEDRLPGDAPDVECGKEGCFIVWHSDQGGAFAAMLDPAEGRVLWRKKFAEKGGHPALGVNDDGQVMVAFYEGARVRVAPLSRDGVGTQSVFAKVTGDQPRPWIAGGREQGEWYVAWQDSEGNHTEAYAARLLCR